MNTLTLAASARTARPPLLLLPSTQRRRQRRADRRRSAGRVAPFCRRLRVQAIQKRGLRACPARARAVGGRLLLTRAAHHAAPGGNPCASGRGAALSPDSTRAEGRVTTRDPARDPRSAPAPRPPLAAPAQLAPLESPEVRETLTLADDTGPVVVEQDDRGSRRLVVVRRHGEAIRARARDREDVAGTGRGQTHRADEDVARLAVS